MTMNPFPPQAYTRETLVKAYQWLQNQNDHIKALATTPDLLISLYMKTKNSGEDFLERPSLKTFKSELKNLAGMMGEFEGDQTAQAPSNQTANFHASVNPSPASNGATHGAQGRPASNPPPTQPGGSPPYSASSVTIPTPPKAESSVSSQPMTTGDSNGPVFRLDPRSLGILQEVKATLNLSSDQEALRMLISMGHNRLKNL